MTTKHIAVPWVVGPDPDGKPDCQSIWTDVPGAINAEIAGRICNPEHAHLFKAAPAMLEALRPLAALPIGAEIAEDRDLVLYKNAGRAVTVGDVLEARAAISAAKD